MSMFHNNTEALAQYIQSMVRLEELQKMTESLDKELADSQRIMSEIKTIYNTVPNGQNVPELNTELRREQLVQYLAADGPREVVQDMEETVGVDIEAILEGLKSHAENLKNNLSHPEPKQEHSERAIIVKLDLAQYAASLEEFSKRLANIKLNPANGDNRNRVMEMKLGMLCEDVNHLTQAVQTTTKLAEVNKNASATQLDHDTVLCYDNLIVRLLHSINETTFLLKN